MKNERLVQIRGGRSQVEFAKDVGLHKNTVARYEAGEREPDGDYLKRLMALGYNANWILTGDGPQRLEGALQSQSQVPRLDPDTITAALKLLSWAFELQGATYDPAKDPDLLADTYAFLAEHEGSVTPDNLVDFSKHLAQKRAAQKEDVSAQKGTGNTAVGSRNTR